jgi:pimeloyl-ACP methyl ester carboxylesterase
LAADGTMATASTRRSFTFATLVLGALSSATAEERACHIDGFETPVRCITYEVPRDYAQPDGATVLLTAVIVPALTARPAPDPLFALAGGPGQAATGLGPGIETAFQRVRRARDLVLFDIRGAGLSTPLVCDNAPDGILGVQASDESLPAGSPVAQMGAFARACAVSHGNAVEHNSFHEVVQDLERFRALMGYDRINIWSASFGTRIAQHYVRAHDARVRALVLDGAAPPGLSAFESVPATSQAALDRLFADCARDTRCGRDFPQLARTFAELLARADAAPETVTWADPRNGKIKAYVFDGDSIRGAVFGGLYVELTRSLLPLAIDRAAASDFAPLLAISATTGSWSNDTMALGSTFSVLCSEDWRQALAITAAQRSGGFMRDLYFRTFNAACEVWPSQPVPDAMLERFQSAAAALAVSGTLDPVTPPELAEQAISQFATSVHVVVPGGFHTNSGNACVARLVAAFIEDPASGGRDQSCLGDAPPPSFAAAGASP